MIDQKFTDEEVIQALKCCADTTKDNCDYCPCKAKGLETGDVCIPAMCQAALDLINKKSEPISCDHEKGGEGETDIYDGHKAEHDILKEFAERVKLEFYREFDEIIPSIMADKIDKIVEELSDGKM